jgi:Tol biopolymer transport system component
MVPDRSFVAHIYVINIDGSNERRLTENEGSYPIWSPDGQQIAFVAAYNDKQLALDLSIMDADGTNVHRLAVGGHVHGGPAWSPDGQEIAFTGGSSICIVNIDGSGLRRLTTPDDYHIDSAPSWNGNSDSTR